MVLLLLMVAQGVWAAPHKDPRTLTAADVDADIWPIVQQINATGWVWTTESCQGHEGGHPPMLGLTTHDPARLFAALRVMGDPSPTFRDDEDPSGGGIEIRWFTTPHFPDLGSVQVRVFVRARDGLDRLRRLAVAVTRDDHKQPYQGGSRQVWR